MAHLGITVRNMEFNGDRKVLIFAGHFSLQCLHTCPKQTWFIANQEIDADGLLGAIKINGPTSMNYDVDLGPVLITDHFHKTAFSQVMLEYMGKRSVS